MISFKTSSILDIDLNIEKMNFEELREFSRNLVRLARIDNELIKIMKNMLEIMENQQGEVNA